LAVHFTSDFVLRDRFVVTFDVDHESNIPTLYSTLAILGCAVLLRVIARQKREAGDRWSRQWTFMSIIFLGLAADEFLGFHEGINAQLDPSGFTRAPWVAVGIVFTIAVALIFFPMIVRLPAPIRRLFILAALIYLSGATLMETVGGHYVKVWGRDSLSYTFCATAEEFLEMMGIVVFIYALLSYLTQDGRRVVLSPEVRAQQDPG
jgi:hypothetical protein